MTPPPQNSGPGSIDDWIAHADSDLQLAELGKGHSGILPSQICFHAQQAVEKPLKAVLLFHQQDFPLTHDIEQLLEIARQAGIEFPAEVDAAGNLTPYAVETRYPGNWGNIPATEVEEALELTRMILNWVKTKVGIDQTSASTDQ